MYGHFLDIESQTTHLPIIVKRTRTGYNVTQLAKHNIPRPTNKSIYYKNPYKYNVSDIIKMSTPNYESDDEDDFTIEPKHIFHMVLGIVFVLCVIYM